MSDDLTARRLQAEAKLDSARMKALYVGQIMIYEEMLRMNTAFALSESTAEGLKPNSPENAKRLLNLISPEFPPERNVGGAKVRIGKTDDLPIYDTRNVDAKVDGRLTRLRSKAGVPGDQSAYYLATEDSLKRYVESLEETLSQVDVSGAQQTTRKGRRVTNRYATPANLPAEVIYQAILDPRVGLDMVREGKNLAAQATRVRKQGNLAQANELESSSQSLIDLGTQILDLRGYASLAEGAPAQIGTEEFEGLGVGTERDIELGLFVEKDIEKDIDGNYYKAGETSNPQGAGRARRVIKPNNYEFQGFFNGINSLTDYETFNFDTAESQGALEGVDPLAAGDAQFALNTAVNNYFGTDIATAVEMANQMRYWELKEEGRISKDMTFQQWINLPNDVPFDIQPFSTSMQGVKQMLLNDESFVQEYDTFENFLEQQGVTADFEAQKDITPETIERIAIERIRQSLSRGNIQRMIQNASVSMKNPTGANATLKAVKRAGPVDPMGNQTEVEIGTFRDVINAARRKYFVDEGSQLDVTDSEVTDAANRLKELGVFDVGLGESTVTRRQVSPLSKDGTELLKTIYRQKRINKIETRDDVSKLLTAVEAELSGPQRKALKAELKNFSQEVINALRVIVSAYRTDKSSKGLKASSLSGKEKTALSRIAGQYKHENQVSIRSTTASEQVTKNLKRIEKGVAKEESKARYKPTRPQLPPTTTAEAQTLFDSLRRLQSQEQEIINRLNALEDTPETKKERKALVDQKRLLSKQIKSRAGEIKKTATGIAQRTGAGVLPTPKAATGVEPTRDPTKLRTPGQSVARQRDQTGERAEVIDGRLAIVQDVEAAQARGQEPIIAEGHDLQMLEVTAAEKARKTQEWRKEIGKRTTQEQSIRNILDTTDLDSWDVALEEREAQEALKEVERGQVGSRTPSWDPEIAPNEPLRIVDGKVVPFDRIVEIRGSRTSPYEGLSVIISSEAGFGINQAKMAGFTEPGVDTGGFSGGDQLAGFYGASQITTETRNEFLEANPSRRNASDRDIAQWSNAGIAEATLSLGGGNPTAIANASNHVPNNSPEQAAQYIIDHNIKVLNIDEARDISEGISNKGEQAELFLSEMFGILEQRGALNPLTRQGGDAWTDATKQRTIGRPVHRLGTVEVNIDGVEQNEFKALSPNAKSSIEVAVVFRPAGKELKQKSVRFTSMAKALTWLTEQEATTNADGFEIDNEQAFDRLVDGSIAGTTNPVPENFSQDVLNNLIRIQVSNDTDYQGALNAAGDRLIVFTHDKREPSFGEVGFASPNKFATALDQAVEEGRTYGQELEILEAPSSAGTVFETQLEVPEIPIPAVQGPEQRKNLDSIRRGNIAARFSIDRKTVPNLVPGMVFRFEGTGRDSILVVENVSAETGSVVIRPATSEEKVNIQRARRTLKPISEQNLHSGPEQRALKRAAELEADPNVEVISQTKVSQEQKTLWQLVKENAKKGNVGEAFRRIKSALSSTKYTPEQQAAFRKYNIDQLTIPELQTALAAYRDNVEMTPENREVVDSIINQPTITQRASTNAKALLASLDDFTEGSTKEKIIDALETFRKASAEGSQKFLGLFGRAQNIDDEVSSLSESQWNVVAKYAQNADLNAKQRQGLRQVADWLGGRTSKPKPQVLRSVLDIPYNDIPGNRKTAFLNDMENAVHVTPQKVIAIPIRPGIGSTTYKVKGVGQPPRTVDIPKGRSAQAQTYLQSLFPDDDIYFTQPVGSEREANDQMQTITQMQAQAVAPAGTGPVSPGSAEPVAPQPTSPIAKSQTRSVAPAPTQTVGQPAATPQATVIKSAQGEIPVGGTPTENVIRNLMGGQEIEPGSPIQTIRDQLNTVNRDGEYSPEQVEEAFQAARYAQNTGQEHDAVVDAFWQTIDESAPDVELVETETGASVPRNTGRGPFGQGRDYVKPLRRPEDMTGQTEPDPQDTTQTTTDTTAAKTYPIPGSGSATGAEMFVDDEFQPNTNVYEDDKVFFPTGGIPQASAGGYPATGMDEEGTVDQQAEKAKELEKAGGKRGIIRTAAGIYKQAVPGVGLGDAGALYTGGYIERWNKLFPDWAEGKRDINLADIQPDDGSRPEFSDVVGVLRMGNHIDDEQAGWLVKMEGLIKRDLELGKFPAAKQHPYWGHIRAKLHDWSAPEVEDGPRKFYLWEDLDLNDANVREGAIAQARTLDVTGRTLGRKYDPASYLEGKHLWMVPGWTDFTKHAVSGERFYDSLQSSLLYATKGGAIRKGTQLFRKLRGVAKAAKGLKGFGGKVVGGTGSALGTIMQGAHQLSYWMEDAALAFDGAAGSQTFREAAGVRPLKIENKAVEFRQRPEAYIQAKQFIENNTDTNGNFSSEERATQFQNLLYDGVPYSDVMVWDLHHTHRDGENEGTPLPQQDKFIQNRFTGTRIPLSRIEQMYIHNYEDKWLNFSAQLTGLRSIKALQKVDRRGEETGEQILTNAELSEAEAALRSLPSFTQDELEGWSIGTPRRTAWTSPPVSRPVTPPAGSWGSATEFVQNWQEEMVGGGIRDAFGNLLGDWDFMGDWGTGAKEGIDRGQLGDGLGGELTSRSITYYPRHKNQRSRASLAPAANVGEQLGGAVSTVVNPIARELGFSGFGYHSAEDMSHVDIKQNIAELPESPSFLYPDYSREEAEQRSWMYRNSGGLIQSNYMLPSQLAPPPEWGQ